MLSFTDLNGNRSFKICRCMFHYNEFGWFIIAFHSVHKDYYCVYVRSDFRDFSWFSNGGLRFRTFCLFIWFPAGFAPKRKKKDLNIFLFFSLLLWISPMVITGWYSLGCHVKCWMLSQIRNVPKTKWKKKKKCNRLTCNAKMATTELHLIMHTCHVRCWMLNVSAFIVSLTHIHTHMFQHFNYMTIARNVRNENYNVSGLRSPVTSGTISKVFFFFSAHSSLFCEVISFSFNSR